MKYYLLHDNSTQWFIKLIELEDGADVKEGDTPQIRDFVDVDLGIRGPYIASIFEREPHFTSRTYYGYSYVGWTISQKEFQYIKRLTELYPLYLEYIKKV